tara:strand:- start:413 stop:736 length:324 start_codon:yes stop_codon:yes gene_type:complete
MTVFNVNQAADLIERLLDEQSKEEDKIIEMYHNQIKRMYFRNCLYQIDYHYKDMEDARNDPEWQDDEDMMEYNIWRPSNVRDRSKWCHEEGPPVPRYEIFRLSITPL